MIQAAFALLLMVIMWAVGQLPEAVGRFGPARISLGYGFLLLEAFLVGEIAARFKLPKISGYILAGILCGPYGLGFIDLHLAGKMKLIDDLALTFIALTAGAELHLAILRKRKKTIGFAIASITLIASCGIAATVALLHNQLPFAQGGGMARLLTIGALFGVIAVARSPTSAIAIIDECRAKGPFTDTVLGVTVAMDSLVILLFAVAISFGEAAVQAEKGVDLAFAMTVVLQLSISILAGVVIGKGVGFYIRRIEKDLTILLVVLSFLITYASQWLSHTLDAQLGFSFHVEPLLIATAAGFVVQNFTGTGERLSESLHSAALPIFVVFFSMTGVTLNLGALADVWVLALLFSGVRMALTSIAGYVGCGLAGEGRQFRKMFGFGFYTQAGVSLGLTQEIARRFPDWGLEAATFLVGCITLNQLVGPVVFKFALGRMGESGQADRETVNASET